MSSEIINLLSPSTHSMKLRVSEDIQVENTDTEAETGYLLPTGNRENFATEPLAAVNMGLQQLRVARGTATRRLRTVKKAWGTFKAKAKRQVPVQQPKLRPQRLWSISLSSPQTPSTRRLMLNSPLTPDPYAPPSSNIHQYRQGCVATPTTPLTTPGGSLRRSARIASKTPTPCREGRSRARRTTPKRIHLSTSPGQILQELNAMTLQVGHRSVPSGVNSLKAMSMGLSETITKQDSSSQLAEIPVQKPVAKTKDQSTDAMETKENELEPRRRIRLRHNRGVVVSKNALDGRMLTEDLVY